MKRVLFVSPTGGYAGIDVSLETLVLGLNPELIEPVVVLAQNTFLKERFEKRGIKCYELPLTWWFPIGFSSSDLLAVLPTLRSKVDPLVQIIKDDKIDIVLSNTSVAMDGAIAAGICGVPHVFFIHAQYVSNIYVDMQQETREFLYTLMGKLSAKLVCCSRHLHGVISCYTDNSMYIYNGVDIGKFVFKQKQKYDSNPQIKMICVGHYNANKQQDFVLRALNILRNERPDILSKVTFTMVGPGEEAYRKKLEYMLQQYDLHSFVSMEEFRSDIHSYLHNFNVYINSSLTENLPYSVLEGMACGLPVLGSINDGTLELVEDGKTGFLCDKPEDMAQRIIELVEKSDLIENMSRNARDFVEENFTAEKYISGFQNLFLELSEKDSIDPSLSQYIRGFYESVVGTSIRKFPYKKVLVLYPPQAMPTYMLCVKYPFDFLTKIGVLEYTSITPSEFKPKMLDEYDVVLCVRYYDDFAYSILRKVQAASKPFVWLIDDNYCGLHIENGKVVHEEAPNPQYERMYIESSHVVVFSGDMYHFGNRLTQNITRAPTIQLDNLQLAKLSPREDKKIVLGFMGTLMRDNDFSCVIPAIKRLIKKYGEDIRVEFIGYCPEELRDTSGVESFDFMPDYEEFRKFFASRKWDVGLAPLADTLFNRCKTNNKYREYSSYGIAGVYSNISAYNCVTHGINGYLTENKEEAWFKAISKLIEDENLRKKISQNAHEDILKNYSVENYAKALMRIFCDVCGDNYGPSIIQGVRTTIRRADGTYHLSRYYTPEDLSLVRIIRKHRSWKVRCPNRTISQIGLLIGEAMEAKGTVTVKIYQEGCLLATSTKRTQEFNYTTWNYFSLGEVAINCEKMLRVEILTDEGNTLSVFEDRKNRKFWYKVFNKLGCPLPGKDVLMVDFI